GLPEAKYQELERSLSPPPSRSRKLVRAGALVATVWGALLALLLLAGWLLSQAAMRVVRSVSEAASGQATGLSAWLRQTYRVVLALSSIFYYLSLPLLTALIILVGGGLIYLLLEMGHIPIKILAIVAGGTLVSLWAILKSLLVRGKDEDPGMKLEPEK